jgi:hypothetical protein
MVVRSVEDHGEDGAPAAHVAAAADHVVASNVNTQHKALSQGKKEEVQRKIWARLPKRLKASFKAFSRNCQPASPQGLQPHPFVLAPQKFAAMHGRAQ